MTDPKVSKRSAAHGGVNAGVSLAFGIGALIGVVYLGYQLVVRSGAMLDSSHGAVACVKEVRKMQAPADRHSFAVRRTVWTRTIGPDSVSAVVLESTDFNKDVELTALCHLNHAYLGAPLTVRVEVLAGDQADRIVHASRGPFTIARDLLLWGVDGGDDYDPTRQ